MVIPGDAYTSNLMVLIEGRADTEIMMPHGSYRQEPTRKDRILLRVWINDGAKDSDVFRDEVLPILDMYCLECHLPGGVGYEKSGLDMRDYESLMKGTRFGPVVNPGDAFTSNLMVLIEGRSKSLCGSEGPVEAGKISHPGMDQPWRQEQLTHRRLLGALKRVSTVSSS
jgi:hypothetical protein